MKITRIPRLRRGSVEPHNQPHDAVNTFDTLLWGRFPLSPASCSRLTFPGIKRRTRWLPCVSLGERINTLRFFVSAFMLVSPWGTSIAQGLRYLQRLFARRSIACNRECDLLSHSRDAAAHGLQIDAIFQVFPFSRMPLMNVVTMP